MRKLVECTFMTLDGVISSPEKWSSPYVIEVSDLDAAAEWAAKMPVAGYGSVEIRPTIGFDLP